MGTFKGEKNIFLAQNIFDR